MSMRSRVARRRALPAIAVALMAFFRAAAAQGQDGYEIQVYGSETMTADMTMVELHSNFTVHGQEQTVDGVLPDHHAMHETLEITRGFSPWFETGFYVFTSIQPGDGWEWVGDHIRPRVRIPEAWEWPVGLSLSMEVGYQRRSFSEDTWTLELRPIIDEQWGPLYVAVNPAFEKSLRGEHSGQGFDFAPSAKVSVAVVDAVALGVEYYASLGPVDHLDPWKQQEHQIFAAVDLNVAPEWEINFGVGWGLTDASDDLVVKLIIGRRF
ncbi:MAG TPA: hypothetical protein VKW04_03065 [Planctomycetota bacterium]|nr:hypothetical protein [Planctomycetota bacterium]